MVQSDPLALPRSSCRRRARGKPSQPYSREMVMEGWARGLGAGAWRARTLIQAASRCSMLGMREA